MNHKKQMLLIVLFLVIITGLVLYGILVMQNKKTELGDTTNQKQTISLATPPQDLAPSYKSSIQNSWDGIALALSTQNAQELEAVVDSIMSLKVPANFKELHVKLVLALSDAQDALPANNNELLAEVNQTLLNIEKEYPWVSL